MKLLIIEDQPELSESIRSYFTHANFICEVAYDYHMALEKVHDHDYDCIILDINLPLGNGFGVLKELQFAGKADGIVIISARHSLDDKVLGLNLGADDYLTKPFHMAELAARVAAIIRRKTFAGKNKIILGGLILDLQGREVKGPKGIIDLTRKEYDLLVYFIGNKNKVVTKEAIVEHLWGDSVDMADNYDFIYSHIKNLRKKLMLAGCPDYVTAIYGMGYKFVAAEGEKQ